MRLKFLKSGKSSFYKIQIIYKIVKNMFNNETKQNEFLIQFKVYNLV